ncbi:hypothetical protein BGW80DRAFT_1453575 [Lactifluus volemus]|nr:hypothetical protein BGW80DRAFT_1453575 [Lactifluus volemus]
MASNLPPTVRLNNYLQGIGQLSAVSYHEKDNGPNAVNRWSITLKINGQVMGASTAPRRSAAKEAAAQQALDSLGLQ